MNIPGPKNGAKSSQKILPENGLKKLDQLQDDQLLKKVGLDEYIVECIQNNEKEIRANMDIVIEQARNVISAAFSPCGLYVATGSKDKTVKVWNIFENKEEFSVNHLNEVSFVSFIQNNLIASASKDNDVKLWDFKNNQEKFSQTYSKNVYSIFFSPDGNSLILAESETVKIYDIINNTEVLTRTHKGNDFSPSFVSPDFNYLASRDEEEKIKVWKINEKEEITINQDGDVSSIAFSSDNHYMALGLNNIVVILNIERNKEEFTGKHSGKIRNVRFSSDGKLIVSSSSDNTVKLWNIQEKINYRIFNETPKRVLFSPNSKYLLIASSDYIKIWNIKKNIKIFNEFLYIEFPYLIKFSPDGSFMSMISKNKVFRICHFKMIRKEIIAKSKQKASSVCISNDGNFFAADFRYNKVKVWNVWENKKEFTGKYPENSGGYSSITSRIMFSPEAKFLASAYNNKVIIWNIREKQIYFIGDHNDHINSICYAFDGSYLVSYSYMSVVFWSMKEKNKEEFIRKDSHDINCICLSSDSNLFALGTTRSQIEIWNIKENKIEFTGVYHQHDVITLEFSPDNKFLASASIDSTVKVLNINKKQVEFTGKHSGPVLSISFSGNNLLASASSDKTVKVWNINDKYEEFCGMHLDQVLSTSFSNDGKLLASGSLDQTVKIWNFSEKREEFCGNHDGEVNSVRFSRYGDYVVSGSKTGVVMLWNFKSKSNRIIHHSEQVNSICFSPNGLFLASGSKDKVLNIMSISDKKIIFTKKYLSPINCLTFSSDSNLIAAVSKRQKTVIVWNIKKNTYEYIGRHQNEVKSVVFSMNSLYLASATADSLKIWDLNGKTEILSLEESSNINSLSFSYCERFIASGSNERTVVVWGINERKSLVSHNHLKAVTLVLFSPSGLLLSASEDGEVNLWKDEGKLHLFTGSHSGKVTSACFSSDSVFFVSASEDTTIKVWNIIHKRLEFSGNHQKTINCTQFLYSNNFFASGSDDCTIKIWNIRERREEFCGNHSNSVLCFSFSPETNLLASGSSDNTVQLWNIFDLPNDLKLNKSEKINSLCFSSDCNFLASGSDKNEVKVWNIRKNREEFHGLHLARVVAVHFSTNNYLLASGSYDTTMKVWNIRSKSLIFTGKFKERVTSVAFSPDSESVVTAYEFNQIKVWNLQSNEKNKVEIDIHQETVNSVCFSPNGRYLGSGSCDKTVKVYNIKDETIEMTGDHSGNVYTVVFSSDNRFIASGSEDSTVKVWNIEEKMLEFTGNHLASISCVVFSNNCNLLASASLDHTAKVWDLKDKTEIFTAKHSEKINSVCLSLNGKYLASGSDDKKVKVWDLSEKKLEFIEKHRDKVQSVLFSACGNFLASGSCDGLVKVWKFKEDRIKHTKMLSAAVLSVCFSPDSRYLATLTSDSEATVWTVSGFKEKFTLSYTGDVSYFSFLPKRNLLLEFKSPGKVSVWDVELNQEGFTQALSIIAKSVWFSPDGLYFVYSSTDDSLKLFGIDNSKEDIINENEEIIAVCFSNDGLTMCVCMSINLFLLWDLTKKQEKKRFGGRYDDVSSLTFSPDDFYLIITHSNRYVTFFELKNLHDTQQYNLDQGSSTIYLFNSDSFAVKGSGHVYFFSNDHQSMSLIIDSTAIFSIFNFKPENDNFFLGAKSNRVYLWDIRKNRYQLIGNHSETINSVIFSPDGKLIASGSDDKTIKIWRSEIHKEILISDSPDISKISENCLAIKSNWIDVICISSDLKASISGFSKASLVKFFSVTQNKCEDHWVQTSNSVNISNNGINFVFWSLKKNLALWSTEEKKVIHYFEELREVTKTCISNMMKFIASGSIKLNIKIWEIEIGESFELIGHKAKVFAMCFSIDDNYFVSGSEDGVIIIWNLISKIEIMQIKEHKGKINSLCISNDNKYLISCSSDSSIKVLDFKNYSILETLRIHSDEVTSISVSNDSKLLISGSNDRTLKVWSLLNKQIIFSKEFSSPVICVRFSTFENLFGVGLGEGLLKIWKYEEVKLDHDKENSSKLSQKSSTINDDISRILHNDEASNYVFSEESSFEIHASESFEHPKDLENQGNSFNLGDNNVSNDISEYKIVQISNSFKILKNHQEIKNFTIIEYENDYLKLQIKSKKITIKLSEPLTINQVYRDLLDYQRKNNCLIDIDTDVIPTDIYLPRPVSIYDQVFYSPIMYLSVMDAIRSRRFTNITPKHCEIMISQNKYTIIHFISLIGESKILQNLLAEDQEKIVIKADIFGKSPFFYSLKAKKLDCFDIIMDYLLKMETNSNEELNILITSLHSSRNDFFLIIKTSSSKLPAFLSKIVINEEKIIEVEESEYLPNYNLSKIMNPIIEEFFMKNLTNQLTKKKNAILKYTALSIPLQPFSKENIEGLTTLYYCHNKKIYDNTLVQFFIDFNIAAIWYWSLSYSILIWIHIVFYGISLVDNNDVNNLIPFWVTYCFILVWELLQLFSNFRDYIYNSWNIVDVSLIIWTPIWSCFRIYSIDHIYSDLFIALLLMIRGVVSFKIFAGTRLYIHLIIQSLNNIKYFLVIFIYSTIFFSIFLFIILDKDQNLNYADVLKKSWALSVSGDTGIESQYQIIFLVIFLSTILNMILMLNMLISILGDSYDQFCLDKNMIDCREKISLALDVQNTLFWMTRPNEKTFVHILSDQFENEMGDEQDWQGRLMYAEQRQEKRIENLTEKIAKFENKIYKKFDESNNELTEKITKFETEIYKKFESEVNKRFDESNNEIARNSEKITGLETKIDDKIEIIQSLLSKLLEKAK